MRQDLGGRPPALGGSGHAHKVQDAVKRALGSDELRRPHPDKHAIARGAVIAGIMHHVTVAYVPIEGVIAHRNYGRGLLARLGVEKADLRMPMFGVVAVGRRELSRRGSGARASHSLCLDRQRA
jgi:hypothetical protein